jgi:hypothetical protein
MRLLPTYILNHPRHPLLGALDVVIRTFLAAGQDPYTWQTVPLKNPPHENVDPSQSRMVMSVFSDFLQHTLDNCIR